MEKEYNEGEIDNLRAEVKDLESQLVTAKYGQGEEGKTGEDLEVERIENESIP